MTEMSWTNGRVCIAPSMVPASMCPEDTSSLNGSAPIWSVMSANRPLSTQYGTRTTSPASRSGSSPLAAAPPTFDSMSSFGMISSLIWFLWLALYASTRRVACASSGARVHIVSSVPSSTPISVLADGSLPPPFVGSGVAVVSSSLHAVSPARAMPATASPATKRVRPRGWTFLIVASPQHFDVEGAARPPGVTVGYFEVPLAVVETNERVFRNPSGGRPATSITWNRFISSRMSLRSVYERGRRGGPPEAGGETP